VPDVLKEQGLTMPTRVRATRAASRTRGFSLIELLVVIVVIAVLLAITLPALRGSKEAAGGTENASAEKQLLTATSLYAEAYDGYPPYLNVPGDPTAPSPRLKDLTYPPSYFGAHRVFWATLLADGEYLTPSLCENRGPDQAPTPAGEPFNTVYFFTQATAAAPAFWVGDTPPNDLSLFRGVRLSRVLFPSAKGLIAYAGWKDFTPSPDPTVFSWPVGFADGSVSVEKLDDTSIWRGFGASSWIVCATEKGVEGRDYP